ncbi:phosphotransferase [Saxibacter everestensis]|uniref:Phosphotransferase n=1 Tax=Saxibacter everestensis TaxID=2909229 RepID=A0ABY8QZ66_9MICO|nr:phosphotransferase [Brevibacteriaceae bacterium ZFBP1038]
MSADTRAGRGLAAMWTRARSGAALPLLLKDEALRDWEVKRAWPGRAGELVVELHAMQDGQTVQQITAGRIFADGTHAIDPPGTDPRLNSLSRFAADGQVIVHRRGKRAVVRRGEGSYVKVVRRNQAEELADQSRLAAKLTAGTGFQAPRLLRVADDWIEHAELPGTSLLQLGMSNASVGQWRAVWEQWANAWPRFVAGGREKLTTAVWPPLHDALREAELLDNAVRKAIAFDVFPVPTERLNLAAGRIIDALLRGESDQHVIAHRDLHDKQILVQPGPVGEVPIGLLDFDTTARSEAALDLANLAVHLEFRYAQGLLSAERWRIGRRAIDSACAALDVTPSRFVAYSDATRLRMACLYAYRPRWAGLAVGRILELCRK